MFSSNIDGVSFTELKIIADERGAVLHMMRNDSDYFTKFGECYFSEIFPGAIKAWKCHTLQTQNFAVPIGRIQVVVYDDRIDSRTRNQLMNFELGRPDKYMRVTIEKGLWYGFRGIGAEPSLLVNCADYPHDKLESKVLDVETDIIPFKW